jgi:hypothetical protein
LPSVPGRAEAGAPTRPVAGQRVVAAHADQVDHAALADQFDATPEQRIIDAVLAVQRGAELVDQRLVRLHAGRAPVLRQFRDDRFGEAALERERPVREPFEFRVPESRVDQDRELVQPRRKRALEAQVRAQLLHAVRQLGAAQQRRERPAHAAARSACDRVVGALLRVGHPLARDLGEAHRYSGSTPAARRMRR